MNQQSRGFATVIVAALLLMAGFLVLLEWQMDRLGWGIQGRDDPDDPGWEELEALVFVVGNVTWEDWNRLRKLSSFRRKSRR